MQVNNNIINLKIFIGKKIKNKKKFQFSAQYEENKPENIYV